MRSAWRRCLPRWCGAVAAVTVALVRGVSPCPAAICEPLAVAAPNVTIFGVDYLPRIDLQPGRLEPDACALPLPAPLPAVIVFPVWAYNLQGEMTGARFRLVSSGELLGFAPAEGFRLVAASVPVAGTSYWTLDIELSGHACGPALLGEASVLAPLGAVSVFLDLLGIGGTGAPVISSALKGDLPAVTPRHGAYAGGADPYHCQPPLCLEPNAPVTDFAPVRSGGFVIELAWLAGAGGFTMIRYRADGRFPTSIFDGDLLTIVPTIPGQSYAVLHENPQVPQYWYTAFAVDMIGDTVTLGSRLECDSFTTATADASIQTTDASWGQLKQLYR